MPPGPATSPGPAALPRPAALALPPGPALPAVPPGPEAGLGRIGLIERPDALVVIEERGKQFRFPDVDPEHHARAAPWLLYGVTDVAGHRWHGVRRQAMHRAPAFPSALQRDRSPLCAGDQIRITHLGSSPERRCRVPRPAEPVRRRQLRARAAAPAVICGPGQSRHTECVKPDCGCSRPSIADPRAMHP